MSAFFVTGTGTGIGKTYVTAGLVRALRMRGIAAVALKPVASGFEQQFADESDPGLLLSAMSRPIDPQNLDAIAPFRFTAPLAPDLAAAREGRTFLLPQLLAFCRKEIDGASGPVLIEGVGGIGSPTAQDATCLEWIVALRLPAVLVAGTYLGAISHTVTAILAMQGARVPLAAVVLTERAGEHVGLRTTRASLSRVLGRMKVAAPLLSVSHDAEIGQFVSIAEALGLM